MRGMAGVLRTASAIPQEAIMFDLLKKKLAG
jgi:hypothetical protein